MKYGIIAGTVDSRSSYDDFRNNISTQAVVQSRYETILVLHRKQQNDSTVVRPKFLRRTFEFLYIAAWILNCVVKEPPLVL